VNFEDRILRDIIRRLQTRVYALEQDLAELREQLGVPGREA
jgi:hypothetical protein